MTAFQLRVLRINAGLSREQLAEKVGVSHPTISSLENGGRPRPETALKVASFFNLKPFDLWPELAEDRPKEAA